MPSISDWKVSPAVQPKPDAYSYDIDRALQSVVGLRATMPADAFTAETLGGAADTVRFGVFAGVFQVRGGRVEIASAGAELGRSGLHGISGDELLRGREDEFLLRLSFLLFLLAGVFVDGAL